MVYFKPYSEEEITIFKTVKQFFETLPPIANDEFKNAFHDLVAQFGVGGEEYMDAGTLFTDLIETQSEIAFDKLGERDKKEIKEFYEKNFIDDQYYDSEAEEFIYDATDLGVFISDRFKSWIYDSFDQEYLYDEVEEEKEEYYEEENEYEDAHQNWDNSVERYEAKNTINMKERRRTYPRNISRQIINGFIKSELEIFKTRFEEERVPGIQDDRSLSIAWLCYYFKDAITSSNALAITNFVDEVHTRDDYRLHCWYRISALQAAAFVLTSNTYYADKLLCNVSCGQGWARGFIVESASIICPLLSFDNRYLRRAVELNLKYGQIYEKESVILYLATRGDSKEKRNWLEQQIKISDKDRHIEFLSKLKDTNRYYKSGFFVKAFSNAKSYFIFKLLCEPRFVKVELELFDRVLLNYEELNNKELSHPLNNQYIDLSFLEEK